MNRDLKSTIAPNASGKILPKTRKASPMMANGFLKKMLAFRAGDTGLDVSKFNDEK